MSKHNKIAIILLVTALLTIGVFQLKSDDKELFMGMNMGDALVKPNVVVLMDNSGSMNTLIFYPMYGLDGIEGTADDGYSMTEVYSGYVESIPTSLDRSGWYARWITSNGTRAEVKDTGELGGFWTGCYEGDGSPDNFRVGSNGVNFRVGDKVLFRDTSSPYTSAVATLKQKYEKDGQPWFEFEDIKGGPIIVDGGHFQQAPTGQDWKPTVVQIYGGIDNGNWTRIPENYVRWLFLHATEEQRDAVSHFTTYGTFDVNFIPPEKEPNNFGDPAWDAHWLSPCTTPGHLRVKERFTRIQVARQVICQVATLSNASVNLGLFRFDGSNGGYKLDDVTPSNDLASDLVAYKNMVADIEADSWTPLAEALADVWKYYKPGPSGSKNYWPTSEYSSVHDVEYWCQQNYAIVMTDGESTQDRFSGDGRFSGSMFREKPVKRTTDYTSFADWSPDDGWGDLDSNEAYYGIPSSYNPNGTYCPNRTCWYTDSGSDYLDDVAYFMRHQDLFPDDYFGTDPVSGWPGDQNILTYTIGFAMDNDMLRETAVNGDGAYYTASNYEELVDAFQSVITGILLRNFSFSAVTAPKKTATTTSDDVTVSYVGYFMPSQSASIWQGHLLAYELWDKWGYDADGLDGITDDEYIYDTELECLTANGGTSVCERLLELNPAHKWDAAEKVPETRRLFTLDTNNNNDMIPFDSTKAVEIQAILGTTDVETQTILETIRKPQLADIYHSDVGYIGPPRVEKKYIPNINSLAENAEDYATFAESKKNRRKVLFTGTNDGILHMLHADDEVHVDEREAGEEVWGFIPDEVHESVKNIVLNHEHTFTVDGRLSAADICFPKTEGADPTWTSILTFGLRRGGKAYYAMDITDYSNTPKFLWKFKDDTWSGQSWGNPQIGKIYVKNSDGTSVVDRWVVVLAGGFAFNEENSDDLEGKAIFMVDAATGELIWMYAYNPGGDPTADDNIVLTDSPLMNFPIPSSCTIADKDDNGFIDTIYFGNIGGHFFEVDIANTDMSVWSVKNLYKTEITTSASSYITAIAADPEPGDNLITITLKSATGFLVGDRVRGLDSKTQGYITLIDGKDFTVYVDSRDPSSPAMPASFIDGEDVVVRTYQPIYMEPAIALNKCYLRWIAFGTGDRDRPRSDPATGMFIALKDNGTSLNTTANLNALAWSDNTLVTEAVGEENNGWYFTYDTAKEKLFDPAPIILPGEDNNPHIYFNTYQPAGEFLNVNKIDNPCSVPVEGSMMLYDLALTTCADDEQVEGTRTPGRIAGGGVYGGGEYLMILGGEDVGSVGQYVTKGKKIGGRGDVLMWKEKER